MTLVARLKLQFQSRQEVAKTVEDLGFIDRVRWIEKQDLTAHQESFLILIACIENYARDKRMIFMDIYWPGVLADVREAPVVPCVNV